MFLLQQQGCQGDEAVVALAVSLEEAVVSEGADLPEAGRLCKLFRVHFIL